MIVARDQLRLTNTRAQGPNFSFSFEGKCAQDQGLTVKRRLGLGVMLTANR